MKDKVEDILKEKGKFFNEPLINIPVTFTIGKGEITPYHLHKALMEYGLKQGWDNVTIHYPNGATGNILKHNVGR